MISLYLCNLALLSMKQHVMNTLL